MINTGGKSPLFCHDAKVDLYQYSAPSRRDADEQRIRSKFESGIYSIVTFACGLCGQATDWLHVAHSQVVTENEVGGGAL